MEVVLSIAGSDSSGGAGIQADIKTMLANGVYAATAITALTAQNTTGVTAISEVTPDFLAAQLDAVFSDFSVRAVKIGMVSSAKLIEMIAKKLLQYQPRDIVLDPVMVATSGARLMEEAAMEALTREMIPLSTIITPNIPEASLLAGMDISCEEDMISAGELLSKEYQTAVLIKGGHQVNTANDLLCLKDGTKHWFRSERIDNPNTHGTGCTLSSAIASNLAKGESMEEAVRHSKEYLAGALRAMLDLGQGSGPLDHGYQLCR